MLTKEEALVFLALLRQFMVDTQLSALSASKLFGVSNATISRWLANAGEAGISRYVAEGITAKINKCNEAHAAIQIYHQLPALNKAERTRLIESVLQGRVTW